MPRYANREMLTAPPSRPGEVPARPKKEEWEGQVFTVRFDDGSGRIMKLRARRPTEKELQESLAWINKHHAEDLQALADI